MKKIISILLIVTTLCLSLIGCGKNIATNDDGKVELTFVLDWTPNTNHTGIYVADKLGYFEDAGLSLKIVQPPDDGATTMVSSGDAQFGVDFQDSLAGAFSLSQPMPVTAVAAILQHNTSGIISLKENGINSPSKMENFNYATWGLPIEQETLRKVIEMDGGTFDNVELIPTYVENIVASLQNDIDTVWIYYGWDGIAAELSGLETNYFNFADIDDTFDYYSPVIIGNNDYIENNPDIAKAFLQAVKKGYEYAITNPEDAAEILLEAAPELDRNLVIESQKWLADQYIADAQSWGIFDADRWNRFYQWLSENNLTENAIPDNYGFTNEYLQ